MAADPQAEQIAARLEAEIARAAAGLVLEITANLVEASPVDTGHVRANFIPAVGEPFAGEAPGGATGAQQAGIAAVLAYKPGDGDLSIANNVPYLDYLLVGSSQQAPAGWDIQAIHKAEATLQAQYDALNIDVTINGYAASVQITPRELPAGPGGKSGKT